MGSSVGVFATAHRPALFWLSLSALPRVLLLTVLDGSRLSARWAGGQAAGAPPSACVRVIRVRSRPSLRSVAPPSPRGALVGCALPSVARAFPRAPLGYALQTSRLTARALRFAPGNVDNE